MDFVNGKADPWGMKVNPSYKKIDAADAPSGRCSTTSSPPTESECYQQNPAPYFTQLAAPVTSLRKIAEAVLDAWPNVQTRCDRRPAPTRGRSAAIDRQGVGTRFMLGLVSLGDAERLRPARGRARDRGGKPTSARPTPRMAAAVRARRAGEDRRRARSRSTWQTVRQGRRPTPAR